MKYILYLTPILVIFLIISVSVNLTLNPQLIEYQYQLPDLEANRYGLSHHQRSLVAIQSLEYLTTWNDLDQAKTVLKNIHFPQSSKPAYTQAEISHLQDVKHLTDLLRSLLLVSFTSLFILAFFVFKHARYRSLFRRGLSWGSAVLITAILFIGLIMFFFWEQFFILFHQTLFPPNTWTFSTDSTLIRLFPEIFWINYAQILVGLILLLCFIVLVFSIILKKATSIDNQKRSTPKSF